MSKYGIAYQHLFKNVEGQTVVTTIYDRALVVADDVDQTIYSLKPAGDPLRTSSINNAEDKFDQPVRSIQAIIKFHSENNFNLSTFADAPIPFGGTDPGDPRWYVEIYVNTSDKYIFKGFLVLDDCTEDFMPYPNVVTLTASDGLGSLKDIPLTDFTGVNPTGDKRIAEFLAFCFSKTGLSLNLNVVWNIREASLPDDHMFDVCFLGSKTFEDTIGTCENCYQALEVILGEMGYATQRTGEWWIVRVDEFGSFVYRTIFLSDGTLSEVIAASTYDKEIGKNGYDIFFSQERTSVRPTRDHKFVKETYDFEFPKEILCNLDFARGDFIANLSPVVIEGVTYTAKSYQIACWIYEKNYPAVTQDSTAYIKRLFNANDYETERYLHMPTAATNAFYYTRCLDRIPMEVKDKFAMGLSFRYSNDLGGGTGSVTLSQAWIRLFGDDGTYWNLHADSTNTVYWVQSDVTWATNQQFAQWIGLKENTNFTEWQTLSFESTPLPTSGEIEIFLLNNQSSGSQDKDFSSLSFDYIPFINGSYQKYTAIYQKVSRSENKKATRDRTVKMSDGIKKLFKGALKLSGGSLTSSFFDWVRDPTASDVKPYAEIQVFDVWNQYRRVMRVFNGTMQGLQSDELDTHSASNYPSLIHRYILQDITLHSTNKYFMLLNFDQDWKLCEWTGTFAEVYDLGKGRDYNDTHEVKYIS